MSDLIVREDAIRDIRSMDVCVVYDDTCSTEDAVEKAIVATKRNAIFGLERMPSVEPEQSIAEWQKDFREYINMLNIPRDDYNGIMEYIDEVPFAQQCMTATSNTMVSETVKIPVMDGTTERLPSAESEQQWIPCSETKENPDHEILACGRRGEMIIGYLVEYSDDQWLCESETEILYDAVAWREKPKPYTERSQDD